MFQYQVPQTGLKLLERYSQTSITLICCMLEQNVKQAELVQEKLSESVRVMWPWNRAELAQEQAQPEAEVNKELAELRQQVEMLNQKIARMENLARSNSWNRSGSGHFKKTV